MQVQISWLLSFGALFQVDCDHDEEVNCKK